VDGPDLDGIGGGFLTGMTWRLLAPVAAGGLKAEGKSPGRQWRRGPR
jgi:hypothetical protein